jgi:predicted NBD/HSP70 family sugar kinase/putative flippase GtrA
MRLSELIIRFIDWFYRRPVSALLPRQTFRYAVCGGANVVFGWGCYFLLYNFVLDKELLDLGFIAVSPHVAAMLIVFPLTFFTGFWLNRHVAFRRSPLATGTQLFRYLLSVAGSVVVNYLFLKFFVEMCGNGYLNVYGKLETNGGRHPNLYGLNPESGYFIGVDIKHSSLHIGVVNFRGDLIDKKLDVPFKNANTKESLDALAGIIQKFIKTLSINSEKILNININISGRVNPASGYSYSIFNFEERPLAEVLREKLGYNVTIENDTRAMTYGEYLQGNVHGEKNIIFVNVSWGLGIGIIVDGRIYTGKSGFAGEFGHVVSYDNEVLCHCGKKGCLETEASGSALIRKLMEREANGEISLLSSRIREKNALTLKDVIAATEKEMTNEQVRQIINKVYMV